MYSSRVAGDASLARFHNLRPEESIVMNELIFHQRPLVLISIVLLGLVLAVELPYRFGRKLVAGERVRDDAWNTLYAGLLALVAFMLALSFAQAQGRFDQRRELVVTEANAIGRTWLRATQLPAPDAMRFRAILRTYAAMRLQAYSKPANLTFFNGAIRKSNIDQDELWTIASKAMRDHPGNLGLSLLMQSLSEHD